MLDEYRAKRDFSKTAEPPPDGGVGEVKRGGPLTFVVQKHAARRLHYDFRLEAGGVLKSWPIPNGPSYRHGERRLAVMTEDHPLDYASFEGVIPKGEYGAGQVIVWDCGIYVPEEHGEPVFNRERADRLVRKGIEQGKLGLLLHGHKLRGGWTLVHTEDKNWLFLKKDDPFASEERDVLLEDRSVLSGLTIEDLKAGRLPSRREQHIVLEAALATGARQSPRPSNLSPMLPSVAERPFSHPNWLFEPKLDGYRVLASIDGETVKLTSRRGLDCSGEYPWLVDALRQQPYRHAIFDGEIVALDDQGRPSFQLLQNRASEPKPALVYYAFDLLYREGFDLRGVPLYQRKQLLQASLIPSARFRMVDTFAEDGVGLFEAARATGMEGVVGKRRDSRYETGRRSDSWLKVKATLSQEFVIGGYTIGSGARADTFGSLVVGYFTDSGGKLTYVGHAGSGFDDRTLQLVFDRLQPLRTDESPFDGEVPKVGMWRRPGKAEGPITWVRPELVAQVKFAEQTSDGILRAPVFVAIREDKLARDVVNVEVVDPPPQIGSPVTLTPVAPVALIEELEQHTGDKLVVNVDGHEIVLTNLNKIFWPAHADRRALTKRDLIVYFARVSPFLLTHTADRPLTLVRFPNGIEGGHFYQKHYEQGLPPFVETTWLYSDQNKGDGEYIRINNLPTLIWLGQLADIELHTWYSRVTTAVDAEGLPTTFAGSLENMQQSVLNYPDFVVFDLDPYLYSGKEARGAEPELHPEGFAATCQVALWLKQMLDELGLTGFVKTTGRTGLHIYVPITRTLDYHATHTLSETLARYLVQQHPREVTAEWAVDKRRGKVFVDYNQNVRGKTLATIYSPRVLPWAAVSMPLRWDEVGVGVFPTDFTIVTAPQRLQQVGDLWSGILEAKRDLGGLLR